MSTEHRKLVGTLIIAGLFITSTIAGPVRYKDSLFSAVTVTGNIVYGYNTTSQGKRDTLILDLYQPTGDTSTQRAAVIFIHDGSFIMGSKNDDNVRLWCNSFAKRGYVTASINYRLSAPTEIFFNANGSTNLFRAIYRAVQDARAATRFIRRNGTAYGIDTSLIFSGGLSAGAVTAVHYAYMTESDGASRYDTTGLGPLENSGGTPGYSSRISGVINCWGALGDTTWMKPGAIPIVGIHGDSDKVVPCDIGRVFNNTTMPYVFGSAALYRAALRLKVPCNVRIFKGMDHSIAVGDLRMDTAITVATGFIYGLLPGNTGIARFSPVVNAPKQPFSVSIQGNELRIDGLNRASSRSLDIVDMAGKSILHADLAQTGSDERILLPLSNLKRAVLIRIRRSDNTSIVQSFIYTH